MFDAVAKALAQGARETGIDQDQKARIARRVLEAMSQHQAIPLTALEIERFINTATA